MSLLILKEVLTSKTANEYAVTNLKKVLLKIN